MPGGVGSVWLKSTIRWSRLRYSGERSLGAKIIAKSAVGRCPENRLRGTRHDGQVRQCRGCACSGRLIPVVSSYSESVTEPSLGVVRVGGGALPRSSSVVIPTTAAKA